MRPPGKPPGRRRRKDSAAVTPAMAGVAADALRQPTAFDVLDAPPIFITGVGRSGTSMTLDLFAAHPQVCAIFESWLLTRGRGITGLFHQPQWHPAFYAEQRERIGLDHAAAGLIPYEVAAAELGELVAGWMLRRRQPGERYLVEKGPVDVPALAALFPQARLVHVIRDGRDVVQSGLRAAGSWAPEMGRGVGAAARHWRDVIAGIRSQAVALGDRYMEVRFEDLRADPRAAAAALFSFGEIEYDELILEAAVAATAPEAYSEASRGSGFRGAGRIGGWREEMTRDVGVRVDRLAGELLVELGYAQDRDWWRALSPGRPLGNLRVAAEDVARRLTARI